MQQMSGGCLCGQIRYSAEAEPIMTAICHCNDCQRQTGSAFAVVIAVPRPALKIQGQAKTFQGQGASGKPTHRHFCPDCGSPIFVEIDVMPDVAFVRCGTLDDKTWLRPTAEVWCETAQTLDPATPGHAAFPENAGLERFYTDRKRQICHCERRTDPRVKPEGMRSNLLESAHLQGIAASLRSSQ